MKNNPRTDEKVKPQSRDQLPGWPDAQSANDLRLTIASLISADPRLPTKEKKTQWLHGRSLYYYHLQEAASLLKIFLLVGNNVESN